MKISGSSANAIKITSLVGLVCGLLMLPVFQVTGKHTRQSNASESPVVAASPTRSSVGRKNPRSMAAYGKLPLSFVENQGQSARDVRFISHGTGYELFLTSKEVVLALPPNVPRDLSPRHRTAYIRALRRQRQTGLLTAIRMHLESANPEPQIVGINPLPGKVNYFTGNDPKKWHTEVPTYAGVKYSGVYPGVDLVFYGAQQRRLEYDFVVAPGANPRAIALKADGAQKIRINSHGDLELSVAGGNVELQKPVVYQNVGGERREIAARYLLARDQRITFAVSRYDHSQPLIIDPVLNYSTYLGGSADDAGFSIAVDSLGDAFVAGQTLSPDFPSGAHGAVSTAPATNLGAAFVAELDPTGTALLYSTYLAGTSTHAFESAFGISVDALGKIYITGLTFATDFPTTSNAFNPGPLTNNPNGAAFVTKLDPAASGAASLLYSTYLAGTGGDYGNAIAADAGGNAYIAGFTDSTDFPTVNPFQGSPSNSVGTGFLTRIDTTQSGTTSLVYSTYFGGNGTNSASFLGFGDQPFGVVADSSQNAYIVGETSSNDSSITTASAYQTTPPAANTQASVFVSRIDTTMTPIPPATTTPASLVYSTYLAGSTLDLGIAIALGPNNVTYITGATSSADFPFPGATAGAFDTAGVPSGKAFVTLVDTTKSGANSLAYSTYLGGTGSDTGNAIRADALGNAYVAGQTGSTDFPTTLGAFQFTRPNVNGDAFITELSPGGNGPADLIYSSYFGGAGNGTNPDRAFGIALDPLNNAYITGQTFSTASSFPVFPAGAFQTNLNGTSDAFVAKLTLIPTLAISPASLDFGVQPVGVTSVAQTVTLTNNTSDPIPFPGGSVSFSGTNAADFSSPSNSCGTSIAAGASCGVSVTFTPSVLGGESGTLVMTVVITNGGLSSSQSFDVSLTGTGSAAAPGVGFAPTTLAFGGRLLTTASAAKMVTLTNTGTAALTINSIATSGDFAQTNTCGTLPGTLAANDNCTISVTFAPTAVGARTGTLTVTDNAGGSPHTVPLTGTGWDFTLTAPTTVTVKKGKTGSFNVTIKPLGGFNQAVTVACAGAVMPVTCTPTSPVTPADGVTPVTSTVTILAKGMMMPPPRTPSPPMSIRQIVPMLLALSLLFCLFMTRRLRTQLGMVTAMIVLLALAGCSSSKVKKGTTNLTITASSGGVSKTATVALTIN